ncbi:MAG TPA: fumarylacetoacetate hydrolase family protein [Anaerolineales bacterium]|nr:fumarylacetoacetate hydrolase family protein [Anaerolineales bacterium]
MKFATISTLQNTSQPALIIDDRVHTLPYPDIFAVMETGAKEAAKKASKDSLSIDEVKFLSPLQPKTLRDAYAFETHVKTANRNRGQDVPEIWYKFPVFYFSNPVNAFGQDDEIPYPSYTSAMDFELEIAAIIGKAGKDIKAADVSDHIFGFTIFNDWSARDLQMLEMKTNFGPVKSKDFACSYGPVIVTHEAIADKATDRPGVYDLEMSAKINSEEVSRGNFNDIYWSFGDIIERVSQSVLLQPGDVIGSGTVGTGCLYELTKNQGPWLNEGDVVELEIERIGTLKNTIGRKPN